MSQNGVQESIRKWKVGVYNCKANKYLTSEMYGKVTINGTSLKKLQVWTIEQDPASNMESKEAKVRIRGVKGNCIVVDKHSNITFSDPDNEDEGDWFTVHYSSDGKWAFHHPGKDRWLGVVDGEPKCVTSKTETCWWSITLYIQPQINLYNVQRKRYAHLDKGQDALVCSEEIPWGEDALLTLEVSEGKYAFKSSNNKYLSQKGELLDVISDDAKFNMEIYSGYLAFKGSEGRYLAGVGSGMIKAKSESVGKDERFVIYDSNPQVQIISENGEGKSVSVKQSTDVSANQSKNMDDCGDTEIFQMEFEKTTGTWAFLTNTSKYWTLKADQQGAIQVAMGKTSQSQFTVEYQDDGSVAFKSADGNYIANKKTGPLFSNNKDDVTKFVINLVNRPLLVLKGEHGFVNISDKSSKCACNTASYATFLVMCKGNGTYNLKAPNGKFVALDDKKTLVLETTGAEFQFQFCGNSQIAIKEKGGKYIRGEQNGTMTADATNIDVSSLWEF